MSDQEELSAPAAIPLTRHHRGHFSLGGLEKKVKMVPEEPGLDWGGGGSESSDCEGQEAGLARQGRQDDDDGIGRGHVSSSVAHGF